jgi:ABC-type amino acid transport substrate-binding protein
MSLVKSGESRRKVGQGASFGALPLTGLVFAGLIAVALPGDGNTALSAETAGAKAALRICADPDNLPFSASDQTNRGLYIEYAEAIAAELGAATEPIWFRNIYGKRAVRSTLLSGQCDMYVGLPAEGFMRPMVAFSKPFLSVGYALVTPKDKPISGLADLHGQKVAAQFASPPQSKLAATDGIELVTVLSPEEGMQALAEGRVAAAYLWGPSAGYLNKTVFADAFALLPTTGRGMRWEVAIGFRPKDTELKAQVEKAMVSLANSVLPALAAKYGFPGETGAISQRKVAP